MTRPSATDTWKSRRRIHRVLQPAGADARTAGAIQPFRSRISQGVGGTGHFPVVPDARIGDGEAQVPSHPSGRFDVGETKVEDHMGHEAKIDPPRLPWVHSASYWRRRDLASPQTDVAPPPGNRGALAESADTMPNTSRGLSLPEGDPAIHAPPVTTCALLPRPAGHVAPECRGCLRVGGAGRWDATVLGTNKLRALGVSTMKSGCLSCQRAGGRFPRMESQEAPAVRSPDYSTQHLAVCFLNIPQILRHTFKMV